MGTMAMQTHEFIEELAEVGFTRQQAEVIARHQAAIIDNNVATKHDIAVLRKDIELLRKDLIIKCGAMFIVGFSIFTGILLGLLPMMLTS